MQVNKPGKNILEVFVIPHNQQAYDTIGDWVAADEDDGITVCVSDLGDWRMEFACAIHEAIEAALRQDPNTSLVRETYMFKLTPRWGGSYDAMDAFAQEAQAHASANPQLVDLLGNSSGERGLDRTRACH